MTVETLMREVHKCRGGGGEVTTAAKCDCKMLTPTSRGGVLRRTRRIVEAAHRATTDFTATAAARKTGAVTAATAGSDGIGPRLGPRGSSSAHLTHVDVHTHAPHPSLLQEGRG